MTYSSLTSNKLHQNNNNDRVSKNKCIKLSSKTMNHIQRICSDFRNNKNYHQDTYHNENYNRLMTTTNNSFDFNDDNNDFNFPENNKSQKSIFHNYYNSNLEFEKEINDLKKEKETLTKNNMHLLRILNIKLKK